MMMEVLKSVLKTLLCMTTLVPSPTKISRWSPWGSMFHGPLLPWLLEVRTCTLHPCHLCAPTHDCLSHSNLQAGHLKQSLFLQTATHAGLLNCPNNVSP